MENQIREFTKKGNRRRLFKRVVSLLCVVVLLFTMNTLKRNANTLERIAMCGLQEHTHTAGCYNSSGELVCAIPEHVHTDACYQQSPSDDLVLNGDDLEIADGLVDAGDTQSLDLSLDLDQGELLDFVQDSDAPASNVQDIGNDMPVLDGDLVFDTSYNNEETQQLAANTSVEEAQGAVDETQSEEAQQLLEEEQIAVEDGQDQPTGEGQEQISFEEDQEQPVEQPTEAAQEQPVEEETEQPVEEEQEQPVEEETEQPVEGEQFVEEDQDQIAIEEQPVVTGQEQPTEEVQEQLVIEEQEEPVVEAQEEPVVEEQGEPVVEEQEEPVVEEQEEPVIEEQEEPVIKEQEEPVVEEQEEPVVEEQEEPVVEEQEEPVVEEQEEPAVEEQEEPVVEEQEEPVVEEQEEPVAEEQEEPVVEEQEEPVVEEQEEPVVEEQEEPVVEEQEEPVVEEQEEPVVEEQEEPVVEEQEEPAVEEQEEPVVEEQEEPAVEAAEQPAEEEAEQPAEEEAEQPAEEEAEQPAEEEAEQPAEEEAEQPAEEEAEQPAEEEAEQPAEEEAEQPAEEEAEQPTEEEAEQPTEEEAEQPAEEEAEQPTEEEAEQPAEEEAEQPTEEEAEQPAEEETEEPAIEEAEQPAEVESDPEAEGESEEEPEARIAYPAKQFRQGTAYINVSVDAPEGAFPEGTVMVVKDVEDQGTIDNIQQSVAEDFVEVTSVHAVDISFWYNDAEIEPLLPIAVVMSAVEAPNADHETVVVHVDDNGETQLVDSEATGAAEAALEMPAAADAEAQAFEADAFSVYALVTKQVIETKYIDDHGDTWRIKVDYGRDAKLPEGASLQVSEVTSDSYLAEAEAALESGKRITKARFFDIKIMDGDREVQPDGQVKVTVTLEGDEGEIEAAENQNDIGNPDVVAMHFVEQDDETVSVEKQSAVETDEGVVFHADGFSAWGVIYTVDFEVEGDQGEITLDFTAFDATTLPEEGEIYYDTEDCCVHVALGLLTRIIGSEAEAGYDIDVDAALVDNYEFDFDKAEMGKADSGMRFEDGELIIASDGFVELTEGERLLRVRATGLTALKQALLEAENVSIEVVSGNVPLGSEASYTAHTDEETAELVENYINNEENGDSEVAGYSAADLKIVRNDETLPVEGQFKVTVDKASLVPVGMKLDKLYHIHDGVVEPLEAVPTEDGLGLVFEVENFSDIVASYTVEFHNADAEVVIKGGSQVLLSALIDELGLTRADGTAFTVDDVASVEFDDPELFQVAEVQKDDEVTLNADTDEEARVTIATGHDFVITSLQPFDETRMVLTLTDGEAVVVKVTDAYPNGGSIFSHTPLFTLNASGSDQTLTVNFKNEADSSNYNISGKYYLFAAIEKDGMKYANMWTISGSSVTLNSGAWANLKANSGSESLSLAAGDTVKFYILTGENSQRADSSKTVPWSYTSNFELDNNAYNIVEGDKIGDKNIKNVDVESGSSATANIMMGDPPKYNVSWSFVGSDGQPVNNPEIVGTYYLLATAYNSDKQPRYALSDKPVDFSSSQPVEFTKFYYNNGDEDTSLTAFNGNTMKVELVSLNDSGNKPTINQAASGNQCTKITPREHDYDSIQNETVGLYKLTGAASGAHYTITGTKMPAYKVTSVFKDSTGAAVAPALAKGYYLVVKTSDNKYYVETYDPAGDCEITQFFGEATGEGTGNSPVAYTSSMTIDEVYLVSKADAASVAAAASVAENKKIKSGSVEFYTLAEDISTDRKQATLTFTMSGDAEMYTSTIKFFDGNAVVIEAAGDIGMHVDEAESTKKAPALSKNYYVLATLVDKMDNSNIVGWAINPVSPNGHAQTSTVFSEFIPFGADGSTTGGTKYVYSSSEDFPYEVVTRLYRTDAPQTDPTYKTLVTDHTSNATDNAESGYEFVGNWNPDATHNEIHLKEASPKTYAVRVRFKANDIASLTGHEITADDKIMVNVKVTHANSNENSYQYDQVLAADFTQLPVDDEGYLYIELPFDTEGDYSFWKDQNGNNKNANHTNAYFTGNESDIQVEIVKLPSQGNPADYKPNTYNNTDTTKFKEGATAAGFTVHYDTRWTNPQNTLSRFHEAENPGSNVIKCYDVIDLILPSADSEYDYATILGPNYMFGITADHLFQNNDLQTNFAVNHYTGHGDYVTPDLSNTPGTIVIGEFNRNTDVMTENHVGPAVNPSSTDDEDMKAGSLHLGSNINGSLVVYADDDSGSRYNTYGIDGGSPVVDERERVHVALQNGANLQSQIVNPAIQYGVNMSRTLAAKDATYTPTFVNDKPYVDTTGYLDNATIYINADALLTAGGEQPDDVYGTLYYLQNLTINKLPGQMLIFNFKNTKNVKLSQFHVQYNGQGDFGTNTTTGKSDVNEKMEEISKHIVWNFASCTGRVELSEVGGICLQPNYGSETQISGTSGGWLVSNGYVYNNSAEWHNFFREVPDSAEVNLIALKTVDNMVPGTNEKFDFDLAEYKVGTGWEFIGTQQNTRSSVKFTIKDEEGTAEADKKLTQGWHVYKITEKQTKPAENTTSFNYNFDVTTYYAAVHVMEFGAARVVSPPIYFRNFTESAFTSESVAGEDVPAALTNKLDTVTFANDVKKVGLSLHKTVEGTDSSKVPFTFEIKAWLGDSGSEHPIDENEKDYIVTGVPGISRIRFTPEDGYSVGTIQLKNGQTATITGLPENTHYSITETAVDGTVINTTTGVANDTGYTAQTTGPRTGTLSTEGTKEDFVNTYHATGSATLKVHKALKNTTNPLPANAFNFELYRVGGSLIETKANDENGNVTFTALTFTEADMEGALLNPVTGKRTKVFMYRVHETDGSLPDFDYSQVINDTDKIVTVTLVDEGNGTIRASAYPADFTFRFNNEKGVEVVLTGSKTLVGRDMKGGEVYRFIVTDNENENRTVATTTVTGARDDEKTTFTFPAIKYTEAGTHNYTIKEVIPTNDDKVTYDTNTYTATVTVTETDGQLSAEVAYSVPADFVNTSNETTSASVEKLWSDGNANHANDSVKVKLYKVYGETVNAPSEADKPAAYTPSGTDTTEEGGKTIDIPGTDYLPADATPISGTEVMLNRGNGWKHTWSKLPTIEDTGSNVWKKVSYYPVEVWSSNGRVTSTAYQLDSSTHKTTVTNTETEEPKGTLKLKKIVTENGVPKSDASGDYYFSLQRVDSTGANQGDPMYIKLWITGNHVDDYRLFRTQTAYTEYRAGRDPYLSPTDDTTSNDIYFNHAAGPDYWAILPNLEEGDYVLTEIDLPNDMNVTAIEGGKNDANLTNRTVTVHVTGGSTITADAQVTYTNNKDTVGSLAVTKEVTTGSVATGKTFTFEVTLTNANNTPYVGNVKVVDSTRATATTATSDSSGKLTVTVTGTDTATISEIPAGTTYTVTEQALAGWAVDGIVYPDDEAVDDVHTINGGDADTVTVTNKEIVSVSANKTWANTEDNKTGTVTYELWKKVGDEDSRNVYEGNRNFTVAKGKGITVDYANNSTETEMSANNWPITFINLPKYDENGQLVTYSIREHKFTYDGRVYEVWWYTDISWDIGYFDENDSNHDEYGWVDKNDLWRMTFDSTTTPGTYAFTNTQLGALKLKKLVLVDGENGSGVNWSRVQGAYDFSVVGPSGAASQITKYVRIIVWDGHIAHSSICDNREDLGKALVYYPDEQTDRWATVEGLQPGTYTITELGACEAGSGNTSSTTPLSNVVVLDSITGGNNDANLTAGTITVTVVGGDTDASEASAQAVFTNSTPYVNVPFKAKKTYQGGTLTEGKFTFTLTETDSSWAALENGVSQTKTNAAPETGNSYADVLFNDVKFTEAGTRYFIITETVGNDTGIIYDTHVQKVTVNVTADASGKLSYAKTYEPEFTETGYDAAFANKRVSLGLKKIVEAHTNSPVGGNLAYTNGTYTFTVTGPTDGTSATHTVVITMADGVMTGATLDGAAITAASENATFDATNGVRLTGLTPGVYTVTEGEWSITGCDNAGMYLKDILVTPSGTVDKANKSATVTIENDATVTVDFTNILEPNKPNLEKQVTNLNDSTDTKAANFISENPWNKSADYDIGDEVPYRITTYLPTNYYRSLDSYTYIIHDTMNHLKYVDGSGRMYAFVKPDSGSDTGAWYDVSSWFSITTGAYANGQQTITVFPTTDNNLKTVTTGQQVTNWGANTHGDEYPYKQPTLADSTDIVNSDIRYLQFRYRAELKEDANIGSTTGNTNTAYLQYSNSATTTANTDSDTNVVYTYKLVVNKQDENGAALAGATFQLFKKYKDSTYAPTGLGEGRTFETGVTSDSSTSVTFYGLDSAVTSLDMSKLTYSNIPGNYYLVTGTVNGAAHTWNGIDDGWYILVETKAPYGYKALTEPVALCVDTTLFASKPGFNSGYINMFPDGGIVSNDVIITRDVNMTGEVTCTLTVPNVPYKLDIKIEKVTTDATPRPLSGAVFKLSKIASWTNEDTPKPVWQAVAGVETSNKNPDTNEPILTGIDGQFTVNGDITLKGLHDGVYKLEEMSSPAGYIITNKTPVTFEIEKGVVKTSSNVLTTGVVYTAKADSRDDVPVDTFTIPNTPGAVLPATGGPGTTLYYGAGAALMLLAVLGLILLNRKRTDGEGIR